MSINNREENLTEYDIQKELEGISELAQEFDESEVSWLR